MWATLLEWSIGKKCQLGCLKTVVRELKMLVRACTGAESYIWLPLSKILKNKEKKKHSKNMKKEELKGKK